MPENTRRIRPEMTVLDIILKYRNTESVFNRYDKKAGECICCNALFDPVEKMAHQYGLNLSDLITDLEAALSGTINNPIKKF